MQKNNWHTEKLTPQNTAAILVDFLDGFLPGLKTIDHPLLRKNAEAFAKLTQIFKLPTILLGEEGGFRGKFFPEVMAHAEHAIAIPRHTPSAWDEPVFREQLKSINRQKIIMGGISLDICTTILALDLLHNGYQPYVIVDVSGSDTRLNETAAMMRLTQAGAVVTNWASVASQIMGDWETPEGPQVGELYQMNSHWGNKL